MPRNYRQIGLGIIRAIVLDDAMVVTRSYLYFPFCLQFSIVIDWSASLSPLATSTLNVLNKITMT
jgi:hypothetical protein